MYFWFFWFSRPFNAAQRWQERQALYVTGANWISTQLSSNCCVRSLQTASYSPSIHFLPGFYNTEANVWPFVCIDTSGGVRDEGRRGKGRKRPLVSIKWNVLCSMWFPPPPKLKQQVHNLVFHPFISAWIVVRLQRVKSMGIGILWKKCSQLVEQMDFSFFFAYFVESLPAGCWPWLLKSDRSDCGPFKLFLLLRLPVCRKQSGPVTRRSPRCSTLSSLALGSYPHVLQERSVSFRKCTPSPQPAVVT